MLEKPPSLVIFDCDGVLVDSEPLAAQAFADALEQLGLFFTAADLDRRFRGRSLGDCMKLLEAEIGALPQDFLEKLKLRTFAQFENGLQAIPGVPALILSLKQAHVPYCVASSGSQEKIRFSLGLTGLLPDFEQSLFSADQVDRGKPAPDLFLFAAKQMGANIHDCVVIEDSLPGVEAGVSAGAQVLGYCPKTHPQWQRHHDELAVRGAKPFAAMSQVPDLLRL